MIQWNQKDFNILTVRNRVLSYLTRNGVVLSVVDKPLYVLGANPSRAGDIWVSPALKRKCGKAIRFIESKNLTVTVGGFESLQDETYWVALGYQLRQVNKDMAARIVLVFVYDVLSLTK